MKKANIFLSFLIVFSLLLSGCTLMIIAPAKGACYVEEYDYCMTVAGGYDCGDMPYYTSEEACTDANSGLLDNNLKCEKDSDCKSNYCKDYGGPKFCEDAPFDTSYYQELTCYDGCIPITTTQRITTECDDIGWDDHKADTCYEDGEYCGDGKINGAEECDGRRLTVEEECPNYGADIGIPWTSGYVGCTDKCVLDESDCDFDIVRKCSEIEDAHCWKFNHNPLKYTGTDPVVFCPDEGDTCYVPKDIPDEELHTDVDSDGDGIEDWEDKDPLNPEITVNINDGGDDDSNALFYAIMIGLGIGLTALFIGIIVLAIWIFNNIKGQTSIVTVFIVFVILILILIGVGVFLYFMTDGHIIFGGADGDNESKIVTVLPSLKTLFRTQLDALYPTYLDTRKTDCTLTNGTWVETKDKMGCFNIPAWDSSLCSNAEILYLRNMCDSIQYATWTCDAHDVGCYYE